MKISVIIPTYNRPDFLLVAIKSIWEQDLLPDEIIIGDDSNNNETERLVEHLLIPNSPVPISYFHHQPPLKQTLNVEFLLQKASCELLLLLHDDDALLPCCLKLLIDPLRKFPEVTASFGKLLLMDNSGKITEGAEKKINEKFCRTADRKGIVDGDWAGTVQMFPSNSFLVRTETAKQVGYNDDGRAGDAVDFYFGFRLGKNQRFFYVDEFTSKYRISLNSVSGSGSVNFISAALKILLEDLEKEKLENKEVLKRIKGLMNPSISEVIRGGDKKQALKWMFSPYYNLFTMRGVKRVLMLFNPFYPCVLLIYQGIVF